uniref:Uncharacterized protein n=1 Tax=Steinernema glaseri TaxID=37863 RepID=A0A1I7YMS7_9BILA
MLRAEELEDVHATSVVSPVTFHVTVQKAASKVATVAATLYATAVKRPATSLASVLTPRMGKSVSTAASTATSLENVPSLVTTVVAVITVRRLDTFAASVPKGTTDINGSLVLKDDEESDLTRCIIVQI